MCNFFIIKSNKFLKKDTTAYFHQYYTGFKKPGNPDFLNVLKNTFRKETRDNLLYARDKVIHILLNDIPQVMRDNKLSECVCVSVPRSKALNTYSPSQLMFKEAVSIAVKKIPGVVDGTNSIVRVVNTRTTHLQSARVYNDGDNPYPGITVNTCRIDKEKIYNQNIILIDDIYTKNVNVDEDCIQALYDHGARNVIFYSIGYTRRNV